MQYREITEERFDRKERKITWDTEKHLTAGDKYFFWFSSMC